MLLFYLFPFLSRIWLGLAIYVRLSVITHRKTIGNNTQKDYR